MDEQQKDLNDRTKESAQPEKQMVRLDAGQFVRINPVPSGAIERVLERVCQLRGSDRKLAMLLLADVLVVFFAKSALVHLAALLASLVAYLVATLIDEDNNGKTKKGEEDL